MSSLKRELSSAHTESAQLARKVAKADGTVAAVKEVKRQESRENARRVDVDEENEEELTAKDKCVAVNAQDTGMVESIKYWARGSIAAVLQLIMALIYSFNLKDQVAAELTLATDETNQCIVDRARAALQILKGCASGQQRRDYRVVLTALSPELKAQGEKTGMQTKVAAALGVNRNRAPFRDSVARRAEIDKAAKQCLAQLKIGDEVKCG
jgi:hypothetical protein